MHQWPYALLRVAAGASSSVGLAVAPYEGKERRRTIVHKGSTQSLGRLLLPSGAADVLPLGILLLRLRVARSDKAVTSYASDRETHGINSTSAHAWVLCHFTSEISANEDVGDLIKNTLLESCSSRKLQCFETNLFMAIDMEATRNMKSPAYCIEHTPVQRRGFLPTSLQVLLQSIWKVHTIITPLYSFGPHGHSGEYKVTPLPLTILTLVCFLF